MHRHDARTLKADVAVERTEPLLQGLGSGCLRSRLKFQQILLKSFCLAPDGLTSVFRPATTVEDTHGKAGAELRESLEYARFGSGVNEF